MTQTMPSPNQRLGLASILSAFCLSAFGGCAGRNLDHSACDEPSCQFSATEWSRLAALSPLPPVPADVSNRYRDLPAAADLGRAFFFDPAFSGPATQVNALGRSTLPARAPIGEATGVSCATCHDLARGGVDVTSVPGNVSQGAGWTDVNALPTVNSVYNHLWFRNGRADSSWAVAVAVAESPTTMNGNRLQTAWVIADRYRDSYDAIFAADGWPLPLPGASAFLAANLDAGGQCATVNGVCPSGCRLANGGCRPRFPLRGKPGKPGCQSGSESEPFGDAWDCMDPADQALVTRVLVNWGKALDAYQATLVSGETTFDRFIKGGPASPAISAAAKRGARLFVGRAACIDCHAGPLLSDDDFHNIGVPQAGPAVPVPADCPSGPPGTLCDCVAGKGCLPWGAWDGLDKLANGKYLRSSAFSDAPTDDSRAGELTRPRTLAADDPLRGAWRTPSLRNVALTAPYMHDGFYRTLAEVVAHYNRGGTAEGVGVPAPQIRPLGLTADEEADLVAFLETLSEPATHPEQDAGAPSDGTDGGASLALTRPWLVAGNAHTCARRLDGTLACWGANGQGQLGNGVTTDAVAAMAVADPVGVDALAAGFSHTCALRGTSVFCWGANDRGQTADSQPLTTHPNVVTGLAPASLIATGYSHTCAVLVSDGAVVCWGLNAQGQLGNGTRVDSPRPVPVPLNGVAVTIPLTGVTAMAAGSLHTCVVTPQAPDAVSCWGDNMYGELGPGTFAAAILRGVLAPLPIAGLTSAFTLAAGDAESCAVIGNGSAQCWGRAFPGAPFRMVVPPFPIVSISSSKIHTCAVLADGTAVCWGDNFGGKLGDGTTTPSTTPVRVAGLTHVIAVAAGGDHSCALLRDGTAYCWGANDHGQLGNGSTMPSLMPTRVVGF